MSNLTLAQAIAKAQVLADAPLGQDTEFLSDLLQISAGTAPDGTFVYRYYYAAARRLQTNLDIQALSSADGGIKFTGQITPITTLLNLQLGVDLSVPLIVPPGFTAIEALQELCGCKGGSGEGGSAIAMSVFTV